jgi:hypothetical protein
MQQEMAVARHLPGPVMDVLRGAPGQRHARVAHGGCRPFARRTPPR